MVNNAVYISRGTVQVMILRRLLYAAAVALLCVRCGAVASPAGEALPKGEDARLDQKITYSTDGTPLSDILDDLSKKTGVSIVAGVDANDWAVRDRKAIIYVTDTKLSDLMQQLSSTFHYHWSKGGDGEKSTYRLWQDRNERDEEESLRASEDSDQSKQARNKRENAISDMVNLGSLSSTDAGNLKTSDPWRYFLATEPLGRDVADFMSNFPEARNAFVQGTEASFAVAELPQAMQDTVKRIAQSYDSLMKSIGSTEDNSSLFAKFDKLQININKQSGGLPVGGKDIVSQSLLGRITIGDFEIPLFDPASPMGKALGEAIISLKNGASKEQVGSRLQEEMTAAVKSTDVDKTPARDITSDPALRARIKLFNATTTATLPVVLKALAIKASLNIVSDCFPSEAPRLDGAEKTLGEQLEAIRTAFGSNWTKAGKNLTLRDKDWFTKRAWAVPGVWMKYWADRGKINNGLLIEDLVQIANLRDVQIDHCVMTDLNLVRLGAGEAARNRQILRFYAALNNDQRAQMSQGKLSVSTLTDDQWGALRMALAAKDAAYSAVTKGNQTIHFAQPAPDSSDLSYTLTYYPSESDPAVTFHMASGVLFGISDKSMDAKPTDSPKAQ